MKNSYTDELGFVIGSYFLASSFDEGTVFLPFPHDKDPLSREKFLKHRVKKYFKPLLDGKPRKIWGTDSPIELFLLQGLSTFNIYPEIQTLIFEDQSIYPNYYEMVYRDEWKKGRITKTEIDLYFPNEKIAIFCDSSFHRGKRKFESARNIDKFLSDIGIKVLRFQTKEILEETSMCVDLILKELFM